jgi:hypothetical protein
MVLLPRHRFIKIIKQKPENCQGCSWNNFLKMELLFLPEPFCPGVVFVYCRVVKQLKSEQAICSIINDRIIKGTNYDIIAGGRVYE